MRLPCTAVNGIFQPLQKQLSGMVRRLLWVERLRTGFQDRQLSQALRQIVLPAFHGDEAEGA